MTRDYIYSLMTDTAAGFTASALKFLLFLASFLYFLAIKIISALRGWGLLSTTHLEAKVISIGNLTVGGTGKTPLVELVADSLFERGKKIAVLTRGYKLSPKGEDADPNREGDEPALLRRNLPRINILVGADRIKNGRAAIRDYGADILVLDDGFQGWGLSRDIDILTIDATNPFGNGHLLPRGILREPVEHMVRANIFVITKTDAATQQEIEAIRVKIRSLNPQAFIVSSVHRPSRVNAFGGGENLTVDWIKGKEFAAVCGIADPAYFTKALKNAGAVIKERIVFEDHHPYSFQDIADIADRCRQVSVKRIITTEKDMIKLKPLMERHAASFEGYGLEFFALGIRIEIVNDYDKFMERLLSK